MGKLSENLSLAPTLFVKDIDRIDCAILDAKTNIVGQSWYVDVFIKGSLDENGFIYDFGKLKTAIKQLIKGSVDHALLIPHVIPQGRSDFELELYENTVKFVSPLWSFEGPKESIYCIDEAQISIRSIETELARLAMGLLPSSITGIQFKLRSEDINPDNEIYYTHGITGHDGNCQRLFHGHRSRFDIFVDGVEHPQLTKQFLKNHLGNRLHILAENQITTEDQRSYVVSYQGSQGRFWGIVPKSLALVIPTETSIEMITKHLMNKLLQTSLDLDIPQGELSMHCYEGIGKGAFTSYTPAENPS